MANIYTKMSLLNQYGWDQWFQAHFSFYKNQNLEAGRVVAIHGHQYLVMSGQGEITAELSGTLLNSKDTCDLPKTGDWIVFRAFDDLGYITEVLPRKNELHRKMPGAGSEKQVLATNIDYAFLVQGLDRDFNLMRLQRYLYQIKSCEIKPVVILNKSDLVEDQALYIDKVNSLGYNCPVILTSVADFQGLEELKNQYLLKGKTSILLGSSGVGKSSLLNSLHGTKAQTTGSLSGSNKKGRHTTTSRHLIMLPGGSLIIDSPGMREFGITAAAEGSTSSGHAQMDELALCCKFPDCSHQEEPGCAVTEAVNMGSLPLLVYQSYLKLLREQQRYNISAQEKKRAAKQFGRMGKEAKNYRKKRKF